MTYYMHLWQYLALGAGPFLALWWSMFAAPTAKTPEERRQATLRRRLRGR